MNTPVIREAVGVFTRKDVLDACKRRDLGAVITALGRQGQLPVLTGIPRDGCGSPSTTSGRQGQDDTRSVRR